MWYCNYHVITQQHHLQSGLFLSTGAKCPSKSSTLLQKLFTYKKFFLSFYKQLIDHYQKKKKKCTEAGRLLTKLWVNIVVLLPQSNCFRILSCTWSHATICSFFKWQQISCSRISSYRDNEAGTAPFKLISVQTSPSDRRWLYPCRGQQLEGNNAPLFVLVHRYWSKGLYWFCHTKSFHNTIIISWSTGHLFN